MTLLQLTLKNLTRRPVRTVLTVLGIGVGIGAVVALLGMARGLSESWSDAYKARGTDLVVRKGNGLQAQPFDSKAIDSVRSIPGLKSATNMLVETMSVEDVPLMVVSGRELGSFVWEALDIKTGRRPKDATEPAVVLGLLAAESLGKTVGDTVTIDVEDFTIVGIADGKAFVENGSIFMELGNLQRVMQKEGRVNFINMKLADGADIVQVLAEVKKAVPNYRVDTARDVTQQNDGVKAFEAMNWGTSAIALLVGTFGVMNTMFMSVFERTREIGILIALGWRRSRILRMIVYESVALCVGAGILGVVFGVTLLKVMAATPWMSGKLEPYIGLDLIGFAMALSLVVGLLSGLYPALHCTKINPSMALRQG
jgi:putative ABC transport system permease protein